MCCGRIAYDMLQASLHASLLQKHAHAEIGPVSAEGLGLQSGFGGEYVAVCSNGAVAPLTDAVSFE